MSRYVSIAELSEVRATDPGRIAALWQERPSRGLLGPDGRLMLVAADHPARNALGVGEEPMAMADRHELLARLVTALERPGVDGVLGTPDILDDLLLLGALEGRVVIGSMNRGGLQGAQFELDDRFTAHTTAAILRDGLHGGKVLLRIDPHDPGSLATMQSVAGAVTELAEAGLIAMVEPFLSTREEGYVRNLLDPDSIMRSMAIAAGLGATSAHTWLKLPVVEDMSRVLSATTLPTLLLGGDPGADRQGTFRRWASALAHPTVRGLVVGRTLLYPPGGDVAAAVDAAVDLVRAGVR